MRCRACNEILTDAEATFKYETIDEYVELCSSCRGLSDIGSSVFIKEESVPLTEIIHIQDQDD